MIIPKIGLFINLVGSFTVTILLFILPVVIYHNVNEVSWLKTFWHFLIIAFGVSLGAVTFYTSLEDIVTLIMEEH